MPKRNEYDRDLKQLPTFEMDDERKKKNLQKIKLTPKEKRKDIFVYPLTIGVFITVIFMGYVLFLEDNNNTMTSNVENQDISTFQGYFDEVEPVYSNYVISSSVNLPERYDKGIAAGYLFNAATFYTPEGKRINPIENDKMIDSYFNYDKDEIESLENNARVDNWIGDAKTTGVYLNSASQYIEQENLSQKLGELKEKMSEISSNETVQNNFEIYRDVTKELALIAREINQVTKTASVYEGNSANWFLRIQPLSEDRNFMSLHFQSNSELNRDNIGEIKISIPDEQFTKEIYVNGRALFIEDLELPFNLNVRETINLEIEMVGHIETISLTRMNDVTN